METESYIQRQLENIGHSCTTFIIAYRISSLRDADKILVMDQGRIIEQGTHEELIAKGIMQPFIITSILWLYRKTDRR